MPKASLLLVDDEKPLLGLLTKYLVRAGFEVDTCESGHEAIEKCRQTPCPFQLIVLDLRLPDMEGEDLLKLLFEANPELLILVSSGSPWQPESLPADLQQRASSLLKPYMPKQLLDEVEALLARR